MHCGENGILRGAGYAVDKYQNKAEQEKNELAKIDDYINGTRNENNKTLTLIKDNFIMNVATGATFTEDLSSFENYKNLNEEDFLIEIIGYSPATTHTSTSSVDYVYITKSYNKETGSLTITAPRSAYEGYGLHLKLNLYLYN